MATLLPLIAALVLSFALAVTLCALGGVLGVMYSIPLRRALVTNSPLPYPEGVACAEVLKVGHASDGGESSRQGLAAIVVGAVDRKSTRLNSSHRT